jgi:hypothetical protein
MKVELWRDVNGYLSQGKPIQSHGCVTLGTIEVTEPEKPKKVVTREMQVACSFLDETHLSTLGRKLPPNAQNLRLLYDIEE